MQQFLYTTAFLVENHYGLESINQFCGELTNHLSIGSETVVPVVDAMASAVAVGTSSAWSLFVLA